MLRIAVFLFVAAVAGRSFANTVSDMRVVGDSDRTRFVIDLQKDPDFAVSRLANPYRLVIDMPDVDFTAGAAPGDGRGLVSGYRFGLIAPGKARIVLDLAGPTKVVNTFVLDPVDPEPARLVVDLVPTTAAEFDAAAQQDRQGQGVAKPVQNLLGPAPGGKPTVVIDPGHGGIDSGAIGKDRTLEKDVTLKFALELARQLRLGGRLEPVLTRQDDSYIALGDRVEVARQRHAALFVSIHADTVAESYVRGATVYTLSDKASDALSASLAAQENRSDILAGLSLEDQPEDVADILFDLARRETRNLSLRFAKTLVQDVSATIPLNGNPQRKAAFKVLKAPDVPSVLLELGYLSNADDEKLFKAPNWPQSGAESAARAIEEFVGEAVTAGQ